MDPGIAVKAQAAADVVGAGALRESPYPPAPPAWTPSSARADALSVRVPYPDPAQLAAWRLFLRAHASVIRRLDADLAETHGLPLNMYDVLVQLVEAGDHRLRMTDLARAVLLSRSGVTRLVDRMVGEGYVRREPDPQDARGVWTVLTDDGYERLRAASSTHLQGVSRYMVSRLEPDELAALGRACAQLVVDDDVR